MEKHLDQSVLSKLPSSYKSHLKQSSSSEEDDMGKPLILLGVCQFELLYLFFLCCYACMLALCMTDFFGYACEGVCLCFGVYWHSMIMFIVSSF